MSGKEKKLIIQEIRKDYGEELAEGATELSQGDEEFNRVDDKFKEARVKDKTFDAVCAEERAAQACS